MKRKKVKFYLNHVIIYKNPSTGWKKAYYLMDDGCEMYVDIYSPSFRVREIREDVVELMTRHFA